MTIIYVLEALVALYLGIGVLLLILFFNQLKSAIDESVKETKLETSIAKALLYIAEVIYTFVMVVFLWAYVLRKSLAIRKGDE